MKKRKKSNKCMYVGDFETTVWDNAIEQDETEVWASGLAQINGDYVRIDNCIEDTYDYLQQELYYQDIIVYYHNLKFDGAFWIDFLMTKLKMKCQVIKNGERVEMCDKKHMRNNMFTCMISSMGQWYTILIKIHGHYLEIRDSLKLIPTSVKSMGKSYKTKHQKLEMEYVSSDRHAHGTITDEETQYLINDLLVVKEVLEIMFSQGHDRLTIGSCCFHEFKKIITDDVYEKYMPDLTEIQVPVDETITSKLTGKTRLRFRHMDDYIRESYHGGWCYVNKRFQNMLLKLGVTADVNSLYPSVMHSSSGNEYPIGEPHWFTGSIPEEALKKHRYYFVRIRSRFYLKNGYLPTIQIKNNHLYRGTEWLETSDIYNKKDDNYYRQYIGTDGEIHEAIPEMVMTCTDLKLFLEHYNVEDYEIVDGCWFYAQAGLFDEYIDKYAEIKKTSTGAVREIAKLYLNNLYGKLAAGVNSSFKYPVLEDGRVVYKTQSEENKKAGFIAIGSAVTSYARYFTITAAQENYRYFCYADTDSIHCCCKPSQLRGITVDPVNFNCWKLEATWDQAIFVRQKTYIEHVIEENLEPIKKFYYNIKCAGMPERSKQLFNACMETHKMRYNLEPVFDKLLGKRTEIENEFLKNRYTIEDFKVGLTVPSKLYPRRVPGGIVLTPGSYQMR